MIKFHVNALDRAIAAIAPGIGAQRLRDRAQFAAMSSMDSGGRRSKDGWNDRWVTRPTDAASDTLHLLPDQRAQSRDLVRSNAIAASAIGTNVNRAVGTGLALSAQPNRRVLGMTEEQAAAWKLQVQSEFSLWADSADCDIRATLNFYDQQELVLRAMLESGDSFTLLPDGERTDAMPYRLRIQVLEADRIGNPNAGADSTECAGGIKFGVGGAPSEYHVYDRHPGSLITGKRGGFGGNWYRRVGEKTGRRVMLHHFKTLRPEQPRGVPYLAPVMQLFKDLGTYTDAEIKAAVVSAFLTVFIQSPAGTGTAPVFGLENGVGAGPKNDEIAMGPGSVIGLAAGEEANVSNPGRPNPAFGPFVDTVIAQLGAGLLIGPEMLMKRYNTSYVAARAAFLDAWKHLLGMRTVVIRTFCQPVYETWLAEAVSIGRIPAPGFFADPLVRWAYTRATWTGDSQGSINPKDEVAAFAAAVDARLLSRERAEWELFGTDFSETYDTKKAEHDRLKRDGMLPVPKAGAAAPDDGAPPDKPAPNGALP